MTQGKDQGSVEFAIDGGWSPIEWCSSRFTPSLAVLSFYVSAPEHSGGPGAPGFALRKETVAR